MSAPTTQAGKRLLDAVWSDLPAGGEAHLSAAILAIEAEARADLAARIIATVEKVPVTVVFDEPVTRLDLTEYHREVLAAIREEAER